MKTILCYGDSNTYGYCPTTGGRYEKSKRWTTILQNLLGDEYEVVAEGLNGRTTAYDRQDVWKNGLTHFKPIFSTHKPVDLIIFMLGTNDVNADLFLSEQQIADGMEKLALEAKNHAPEAQEYVPKIMIVVPAVILPDYHNSPFADQLDDESIRKSNAIAPLYEVVAKRQGCIYVDCSHRLEVSPLDSEHLTEKGHEQLAYILRDAVIENL